MVSREASERGSVFLHIERSMEPDAMCWPEGSNRTAKTSPEWPIMSSVKSKLQEVFLVEIPASSMIGACSPLVRETYTSHLYISEHSPFKMTLASSMPSCAWTRSKTYRLYKRSILAAAIDHGNTAVQVCLAPLPLDELVRPERVSGRSLLSRHDDIGSEVASKIFKNQSKGCCCATKFLFSRLA